MSYFVNGKSRFEEQFLDQEMVADVQDSRGNLFPQSGTFNQKSQFRLYAGRTFDQGVVELVVYPNLEDFPNWEEVFGPMDREMVEFRLLFDIPEMVIKGKKVRFLEVVSNIYSVIFRFSYHTGIGDSIKVGIPEELLDSFFDVIHTDFDKEVSFNRDVIESLLSEYDHTPSDDLIKEVNLWNSTEWVAYKGVLTEYEMDEGDGMRSVRLVSESRDHTWWYDPTKQFQGDCTLSGLKAQGIRGFLEKPKKRNALEEHMKPILAEVFDRVKEIWLSDNLDKIISLIPEEADYRSPEEKILDGFRHRKFEEDGKKYITAWRVMPGESSQPYWLLGTWERNTSWNKDQPLFVHQRIEFYSALVEDQWDKYLSKLTEAWNKFSSFTPNAGSKKEENRTLARKLRAQGRPIPKALRKYL